MGINVVNADGTELKSLTTNRDDTWPTWSPDGKQIAFWRGADLWLMNADGSDAKPMPALTPLGKVRGGGRIAWQRGAPAATPSAFAIYGRVVDASGNALTSYEVRLDGTRAATLRTDSNGNFSFGNLPTGGNYYVSVPESIFWAANTQLHSFPALNSDQRADFLLTPIRYQLSGRVTDAAGLAISGVRVDLLRFGSFSESRTTDANGFYQFAAVTPGTGTQLRPASSFIASFEPATVSFPSLLSHQVVNFVGTRRPFTINGKVTDAAGKAIADATVTLGGAGNATATTDANGAYSLPGVVGGLDYTLTAAKPGPTMAPAQRQLTLLSSNRTVNFVAGIAALTGANGATFQPGDVAPLGLGAALGNALTNLNTEVKPPTTRFQGLSLSVQDNSGVERTAYLLRVSPTSIQFEVPSGTVVGEALLTLKNNDLIIGMGTVNVALLAPALLSADGSGMGLALGYHYRVKDNTRTSSNVALAQFDATQNRFVPIPIKFGAEGEITNLNLQATGTRNRQRLSDFVLKIGGELVPVTALNYSVTQPYGQDDLFCTLPRNLQGRGDVEIELIFAGKLLNKVLVRFE